MIRKINDENQLKQTTKQTQEQEQNIKEVSQLLDQTQIQFKELVEK